MIHFRTAELVDIQQLAQLRWDFRAGDGEVPTVSFEAFVDAYGRWFRDGLDAGKRVHWVADDSGVIVATATVVLVEMVPRPCRVHDQFGYLTDTYTVPEYRNQALGTKLIQRVIEWAKERDLELLLVWPSERARSFYARLGFTSAGSPDTLILRPFE